MQQATVETPSPTVACAEEKRQLCRDIISGTSGMISAGKRWLPQHLGESDANYKARLGSNILTNFLSQAVDKQVGKIFSKPITLCDNVPPEIISLCENIDRQGCGLDSFAMDVCKAAFVDGISYILADYPKVDGVLTLADEKNLGARPYAVHVKACCLLEVLAEQIGGVETITRIRVKECTMQPGDGWSYNEVEQVRVLRREPDGSIWYELWQEIENNNASGVSDQWVKIEEGKTAFKAIYLIPIYTNRTGFMQGLPPNQAIAELNLRHWRSMSEQINALSFQRFAMLSAIGITEESTVLIGPSKLLRSPNPEAKFSFVEPTGKGVEMGRLDLESIEKAIETASATLRVERGGQVTATAAAIDSNETNAGLKAIAGGIKDSLEQLLMAFAEMMGKGADQGGEVDVCQEFGESKGTAQGLQSLDKARALGDLSRDNYLKALIWRGELDEDFDLDINAEELSSEGPSLADMQQQKPMAGGGDNAGT
ncbi:MAG: DUF4055 domain-containing protein [Desulfuromonadales bacterium]